MDGWMLLTMCLLEQFNKKRVFMHKPPRLLIVILLVGVMSHIFLSGSRRLYSKGVRRNHLQLKSFRSDQSKQRHCSNIASNQNCKASIKPCRVLHPHLPCDFVPNMSTTLLTFLSHPPFRIHSIFYTSNNFHNCHLASHSVCLALSGPPLFTKH